ncbi:hypothetical protein PG984_006171 [Apiospora sp. TS-2023a]
MGSDLACTGVTAAAIHEGQQRHVAAVQYRAGFETAVASRGRLRSDDIYMSQRYWAFCTTPSKDGAYIVSKCLDVTQDTAPAERAVSPPHPDANIPIPSHHISYIHSRNDEVASQQQISFGALLRRQYGARDTAKERMAGGVRGSHAGSAPPLVIDSGLA